MSVKTLAKALLMSGVSINDPDLRAEVEKLAADKDDSKKVDFKKEITKNA